MLGLGLATTLAAAGELEADRHLGSNPAPERAICAELLHTQAAVTLGSTPRNEHESASEAARMAVGAWQSKAGSYYGTAFENWQSADDRSVTCALREGVARCIASAYPCDAGGTQPRSKG